MSQRSPAKSPAERQRERRERLRLGSVPRISIPGPERQRRYRERARERAVSQALSASINDANSSFLASTLYFRQEFDLNQFGHLCNVCDRIWFQKDLTPVKESHLAVLEPDFGNSAKDFALCGSCKVSLDRGKIPTISVTNGFKYPPRPDGLPELNPVSSRLISPRLPFMSIRRLRRDGAFSILGQVINIPVDVDNMVNQLPRQLDDDYCINVNIKRQIVHKSNYLSDYVQKRDLKVWLRYLVKQPLFVFYGITINWENFDSIRPLDQPDQGAIVEEMDPNGPDINHLIAQQHTTLWDESTVLNLAPGANIRPLNLIFDSFAEELSFPEIYLGVGRYFPPELRVTPYMIANSELRRADRRGAKPDHLLYMAMKILRHRVVDGIYKTFRCIGETENITKRMLQSREYFEQCVEHNFAFLKSIPNSAQYWLSKRKELFAMIRQLGKPQLFLTLSANEIGWPNLLATLKRLSKRFGDLSVNDPLKDLTRSQRCQLVNEDPVTCSAYFHKLVSIIMKMLCSKRGPNPFSPYRVIDYFMRIEFQHRGSPHAHILLWLDGEPNESISEIMPRTLRLMDYLLSVSSRDVNQTQYEYQVHQHTFTCTKRGETSCRFGIPYWPSKSTKILLPLAIDDGRKSSLKARSKILKDKLSTILYRSIDEFFGDCGLDEENYILTIRATLNRPTILFKRDMSEIRTNTFNPWIASVLNSNMDIQYILDEYSCAAYIVDYVNKSSRGTGNLHREIIRLSEANPEMTYESLLKKLGSKILNSVELSAQEAAWFLLRQPMSSSSRECIYIPTCMPHERQKTHKQKRLLNRLSSDSTDIWTKSLIEKYEERPLDLESICLADFAALYTQRSNVASNTDDDDCDIDGSVSVAPASAEYRRREFPRIIRYRNYDASDSDNHKREMVILYVQFRSELAEILDRRKYLRTYDDNIHMIARKRAEYENSEFSKVMEEYHALKAADLTRQSEVPSRREAFVRDILGENQVENFDDFEFGTANTMTSTVTRRESLLTSEEYCTRVRTTNKRQRELINEIIHRIHTDNCDPIQIFLTGPAGCGKTYLLKLVMDTYNKYSKTRNDLNNSYVACASTGKAAVNLGGTTVHSAFHITQSRRANPIAHETLQSFRRLFRDVNCVIVDEVSMVSNDLIHQVNHRLQEITGVMDQYFGGMDTIFCGDFKQLPPVNASPVYKGSRNHMEGHLLWHSLSYFPLEEVMRQKDERFSSILSKIGNGFALGSSESELIESRFRSEEWCEANLKGVIRLFHRNCHVDEYNRKALTGGVLCEAKDIYTGYRDDDNLASARRKVHRLSCMETGGLPYSIMLCVGFPYMITTNIDIEDGLVNGSIGILRYIEELPADTRTEEARVYRIRIWVELDPMHVGRRARMKHPITSSMGASMIKDNWTPITMRSTSINLGNQLRCRRMQLPITPACAITIHKSQGGTFSSAVVYYEKSQQTQLVYVALSRVTSLDGLYLVSVNKDHAFHHKSGSAAPSLREIRHEYNRLRQHPLCTINDRIRDFIEPINRKNLVVCTMNVQSLVAHSKDLEGDVLINQSHFLALTETWMNNETIVDLAGYEMMTFDRCEVVETQQRRIAGGVAIYKAKTFQDGCSSIPIRISLAERINTVGNACGVELHLSGRYPVTLVVVYLHPHAPRRDIEMFINALMECLPVRSSNQPLIITGDFNTNIDDNPWLGNLMSNNGFNLVENDGPTTLGGTKIDHTFTKNIEISSKSYVSYFSYHRPLFLKVRIN